MVHFMSPLAHSIICNIFWLARKATANYVKYISMNAAYRRLC